MNVRVSRPEALDPVRAQVLRVQQLVGGLGKTWSVKFSMPGTARQPPRTLHPRRGAPPKQATVAEVLRYFTLGTRNMPARNVFEVNDYLRGVVTSKLTERVMQRLAAGSDAYTPQQLMQAAAFDVRAVALQRLTTGGGDLDLAPLSWSHLKRKAALGYPARIGTMTGQTARALRAALPVVTRAG